MRLYLVHHAEAVPPEVDPQRPLTAHGIASLGELARRAAARGVSPGVIWHSGKLRARATAEALWRACNPLAEMRAVRGLQPADWPVLLRDALFGETRDVMAVGHLPNLSRVLGLLLTGRPDAAPPFPQHGLIALDRDEHGWTEVWRIEP